MLQKLRGAEQNLKAIASEDTAVTALASNGMLVIHGYLMFEGMSTSRYRHRSGQGGPHQVSLALQLHAENALPETTQQAPHKT